MFYSRNGATRGKFRIGVRASVLGYRIGVRVSVLGYRIGVRVSVSGLGIWGYG